MNEKEKDYVAAVLEDVNHNFKAFGEALDFVREKGNATFEEVGRINEKLTSVEANQILMQGEMKSIGGEIKEIKQDIRIIKSEIISIKNEIKDLKLSLSKKADVEKLGQLELRIIKIEQYLKVSTV